MTRIILLKLVFLSLGTLIDSDLFYYGAHLTDLGSLCIGSTFKRSFTFDLVLYAYYWYFPNYFKA